jgi:DNA-directed RNA polymerase subunit RPC12/RpoP
MSEVMIGDVRKCLRCGHEWRLRRAAESIVCPKCHSVYWNQPKQRMTKKEILADE